MESYKIFNDPIHSSVPMPRHCQIIIDTPEFQRLRFIKQLGCSCYVFPGAVHTRFEHSIGVSYLAGKLASMLRQNDGNGEKLITKIEVICVEIAGLCRNLGHGPFSHAFEDMVPPDKDGKKWNHEEQSVILFEYIIKHNSLEKKLEDEHGIYKTEREIICQLILGFKKNENMIRENKFYLYQIVNNIVSGVDVNTWDHVARDAHYLGMKSTFDLSRILPFVKVVNVKRGSETRRELCFRDKVESDLKDMFVARHRLHNSSDQHRVSKIITIMLKDAFIEAAGHLKFFGEDENGLRKEYNLLESVYNAEAFCQVNDTIVNEIMRSQSQEPGMVKAREIIDRIHKRDLYPCIAECQHANEKMFKVDSAEIKAYIEEPPSPSSSSSSEIWQGRNIEVEVSYSDCGSEDRNLLLDIPFYKKSIDGKCVAEFLPVDRDHHPAVDELPADLPQRLVNVTYIRIYTKVPKLDRETIKKAKDRCQTRLEKKYGRRRTVPSTPVKQKLKSQPIGPWDPSPPISSSPGSGSNGSTDEDAGIRSLMSNPPESQSLEPEAKVTLDCAKRQINF